jgi:hypothetical protein
MKAEYTPGPWTVICGVDGAVIHNGVTISSVCDGATAWKANSRLMAAAPELLEALEMALGAVEYFDEHEGAPMLLDAVRAAIAKARGGVR